MIDDIPLQVLPLGAPSISKKKKNLEWAVLFQAGADHVAPRAELLSSLQRLSRRQTPGRWRRPAVVATGRRPAGHPFAQSTSCGCNPVLLSGLGRVPTLRSPTACAYQVLLAGLLPTLKSPLPNESPYNQPTSRQDDVSPPRRPSATSHVYSRAMSVRQGVNHNGHRETK